MTVACPCCADGAMTRADYTCDECRIWRLASLAIEALELAMADGSEPYIENIVRAAVQLDDFDRVLVEVYARIPTVGSLPS